MIIYVDNPKELTKKKILELINNDSKVVGYKVDIQKPIVFLHMKNELIEFENKKYHLH